MWGEGIILMKQFKKAINMGFGSAILALKKTPGNNKYYRDAVLYSCLHDTRYDWQCEDARHYYLYEAINLIADKTDFEDKIIEKLYKTESLAALPQSTYSLRNFFSCPLSKIYLEDKDTIMV